MTRKMINSKIFLFLVGASFLLLGYNAFSEEHGKKEASHSGHEYEPKQETPDLKPSERFSGATPIDLKNGGIANRGTFGKPNPEIESWAKAKLLAPGIADKNYTYADKDRFVKVVDERIAFYETAVWNWGRSSEITKPEAIEYAKQSTADIQPRIDRARSALKEASKSSTGNWDQSQENAKKALMDLVVAYGKAHRNVDVID